MADSTLDSELIVLFDRWPGPAKRIAPDQIPSGSWLSPIHHNVVQPVYAPGTKLCTWNDDAVAGVEGMYTMIYLQYETEGAAGAMAAKQFVVSQSVTEWWQITNDPDDAALVVANALSAVALSACTDEYWGWYWCGGVAPEQHVRAMGGNYATAASTVAGAIVVSDLDADEMGVGPVGADTAAICGFALADDA